MTPPTPWLCHGCGQRLAPNDDVRQLHRHLPDAPGGDDATYPIIAYSHVGHEPNHSYRITGRGLLGTLEAARAAQAEGDGEPA